VEVIEKIPIESGEHFLAINEDSNTIFVSNNKSDSILTIDGTTNKIVSKIQIERPRQLALNPSDNTLFAISENAGFWLRDTGAKISIGQKRCNSCDIFVEWNGVFCPCCGMKLRVTPRNRKWKEKILNFSRI